jgi:hypothetical protein
VDGTPELEAESAASMSVAAPVNWDDNSRFLMI